jgi:hypothetical protein
MTNGINLSIKFSGNTRENKEEIMKKLFRKNFVSVFVAMVLLISMYATNLALPVMYLMEHTSKTSSDIKSSTTPKTSNTGGIDLQQFKSEATAMGGYAVTNEEDFLRQGNAKSQSLEYVKKLSRSTQQKVIVRENLTGNPIQNAVVSF